MTKFNPDTYHVSQDLGPEWADHPDLAHIEGGEKVRNLAVPVSVLVNDPDNARLHPEPNMNGVKGSLAKYKQRQVICVNKRNLVIEAGNARLVAGISLGWRFVAVLWVDDDPLTQTGYAIADNRTAEQATWDLPVLFGQLESLKEANYEVPSIDQAFFNELEVLVKGATFAPLPEVPDEEAGERNEGIKVQVVLENVDAWKPATLAIKELLDQNPEWRGRVVRAGAAAKSDMAKPEATVE